LKNREDLVAGVYAASIAFTFLVSFVGAFLLPGSLIPGPWFGALALVGFFLGCDSLSFLGKHLTWNISIFLAVGIERASIRDFFGVFNGCRTW